MRPLLVRGLPWQQQQLHEPSRVPESMSGTGTEPAGSPARSELWNRIHAWSGRRSRLQGRRVHGWTVTQHGEDFHGSRRLRLHQQTGHECSQTGPQRQSVSAGTPAFYCRRRTALRPGRKVRPSKTQRARQKADASSTTGLIMLLKSLLTLLKEPSPLRPALTESRNKA